MGKIDIRKWEQSGERIFLFICNKNSRIVNEDWCVNRCQEECTIKDGFLSNKFKEFYKDNSKCQNENCSNPLSQTNIYFYWCLKKNKLLPNSLKIICCKCADLKNREVNFKFGS